MASIFLESQRRVRASAGEVRTELRRALAELGCSITAEQLTLIEAKRGSMVAGALALHGKLPVAVNIALTPLADGCQVVVRLSDHMTSPIGRTWGMNGPFEKVFREMQHEIDSALARTDPSAAAGFSPPQFSSRTKTVGVLEASNRLTGQVSDAAVAKANQVLEGGPRTRVPPAWKNLSTVILRAADGAARFDLKELEAHLAVAVMVTTRPGSMPPALAGQVEAFAARVESELNRAGPNTQVEIPVSAGEKPVVEFLHQQATIREQLPVRTLHRCETCKLEKVTNPDYERLQKRNQHLRNIVGSVGATVSSSGVSPFLLVGTIFRFAKLDPDYVCPRCQGTAAEASVVTYCPRCGEMRPEPVLRTCPKCQFDLRAGIVKDEIWEPYPDPAAETGPAAVDSLIAPAGPVAQPALTGTLMAPAAWMPVSAPPPILAGAPAAAMLPGPSTTPLPYPPPPPAAPASFPAPPPMAAAPPMAGPPPPPPITVQAPAPNVPVAGAHGGKICGICGEEFSTLWRVVVPVAGGQQEWFVCGRAPRCSPQSVVPPTPV